MTCCKTSNQYAHWLSKLFQSIEVNTNTKMKIISTPRHVDLAITGKCNLACQYCFYADEMVARNDLSTATWLSLFEELAQLGVMTVCLTGGEVFTRPDLFQLIDGVIANRMRYEMLSNGTLITEKTLARFEQGKRRQRLNSIQLSLDGASAEIHDRSRPNSFQRVLRALKLLHQADYPVSVRVTINRFNVNDLNNIAHLLLEEIGLADFSTNEAYDCGETDRNAKNAILTPEQREHAMQSLMQLVEKYPGRIQAQAGPLVLATEMHSIEAMMLAGQSSRQGGGTLSSCGCAFSKLAVLHDGTIVPCHVLSTLRLGKIGVDRLQDIWFNHPILEDLRRRQQIPITSLPTCRDCPYSGFCHGGCPGGALYAYGTINARNPMNCMRVLKNEDPFYSLAADTAEQAMDERNA